MKIKPHYYIDVPICPMCGHNHTGFYVNYTGDNPGGIIAFHLRHGEYVTPRVYSDEWNCYCPDCGYKWNMILPHRWISSQELKEIKYMKDIEQSDIITNEDAAVIEKIEKKKAKKEKKHAFFNKHGKAGIKKVAKSVFVDSTIGVIKDAFPTNNKSQ